MTCICALVKDGNVWIAGDRMGSNGFQGKTYPDSKVFANGDFIFGYTSSFRLGQLLEYNWTQPPRLEGLSDRDYLQLDIVESIRSCFNQYGYGIKDGLEDIGGNFIIGYKGCIYEMQHNYSILRSLDYIALGSGQSHAEAVLGLLIDDNPDFDPTTVLQKAISVAAKFVFSVSEECDILTTDEDYLPLPDGVPEREEAASWSKERLLSFLYDEDYDESAWEEETEVVKVINDKESALIELLPSDTSAEYNGECNTLSFDDVYIQSDGIYDSVSGGYLFYGELSPAELKELATELGITFNRNYSKVKMLELIEDFINKVVAILQS